MRKTPNTHRDTTPQILTTPVGVDTIVKVLQEQLPIDLPWLEKSFNRATIMSKLDQDGTDNIFPICQVATGKDPFIMIGNDNWNAYSFFVSQGNETPEDYEQFNINNYERDLSLYVMINLEKVAVIHTYEYPENLKQEIILSVSNTVFANDDNLTIVDIVDNPLDVFDGFTVDPTTTQLLYDEYYGLRIDLNASYTGNYTCV